MENKTNLAALLEVLPPCNAKATVFGGIEVTVLSKDKSHVELSFTATKEWASAPFDGNKDVPMEKEAKNVENACMYSNRDVSAQIMTEQLFDENISTYKMFENLAEKFVERPDLREGIDFAVSEITGLSMKELSEKILERSTEIPERDEDNQER